MTIVAVAYDHNDHPYMVADRICYPFERPVWSFLPKIFKCEDSGYLLGVSGNIVNSAVQRILDGEEDFFSLEIPPTDTHFILLTNEDVWIYKANDTHPCWYRPTVVGESAAIGCFATILETGSCYGARIDLKEAMSRIGALHAAFGFQHPGVDVLHL